jgi:hypothetical protein
LIGKYSDILGKGVSFCVWVSYGKNFSWRGEFPEGMNFRGICLNLYKEFVYLLNFTCGGVLEESGKGDLFPRI